MKNIGFKRSEFEISSGKKKIASDLEKESFHNI